MAFIKSRTQRTANFHGVDVVQSGHKRVGGSKSGCWTWWYVLHVYELAVNYTVCRPCAATILVPKEEIAIADKVAGVVVCRVKVAATCLR
jgi:hypothetical protein